MTNANILGYQTGGLVGKALGGCRFENCVSKNVTIRIRPMILRTTYVSGLAGKIETGAITVGRATEFINCATPANVIFLNDKDGSDSNYSPANPLYGGCPTNEELIVIQ